MRLATWGRAEQRIRLSSIKLSDNPSGVGRTLVDPSDSNQPVDAVPIEACVCRFAFGTKRPVLVSQAWTRCRIDRWSVQGTMRAHRCGKTPDTMRSVEMRKRRSATLPKPCRRTEDALPYSTLE